MLSQFTSQHETHITLAELDYDFPSDVYPVGRLDHDSEGLLFLTNDKALNQRLLHPSNQHERKYWSQVEGAPTAQELEPLRHGVEIRPSKKHYTTLPAKVDILQEAPALPDRNPPIRDRKNIPTTWLELTLIEGKNRQVRKMTAKVGFPTLRLVRASMEGIELGDLQPGEVKEMTQEEVYQQLFGEVV